MIGYPEAWHRLSEGVVRLPNEHVGLADAAGRVTGCEIVSSRALPPFDNAAMDGVGLVTQGMGAPANSQWRIGGRIGAGDVAQAVDGTAWEIMTGAPLPQGVDSVVPYERIEQLPEDGEVSGIHVRLLSDSQPGANIRRRGEDVQEGHVLLPRGALVETGGLMLLAGAGIDLLTAVRRPRVALIGTGREILVAGSPLRAGRIHDATSPYLVAAAAAAGAEMIQVFQVADDEAAFHAAVDAVAGDVDLVISTGAVSKGCYDFVPSALNARGADILFHGVAIRPGKPVLAARLREGAVFLGLPGNPLSTAVGWRFFAEPLIRAWLGMASEEDRKLPLAAACDKRVGLHVFLHGTLQINEQGRLQACAAASQASFRLVPFSRSRVWISVQSDAECLEAGARVAVHSLGHLGALPWLHA